LTGGRAPTIVGLGEALFDLYPDGARTLGGAPLNFAFHACQLGATAMPVTRVGADTAGADAIAALAAWGISTDFVQTDAELPTGVVRVTVGDHGEPAYEIAEPAAWDAIAWQAPMEALSASCDAVCFGTLAQRSARSRETVERFVRTAQHALRLFDVNLRQHYFSRDLLRRGFELANAVKLNTEELATIGTSPEELIAAFSLDSLILTRGERGTVLYTRDGRYEGEPARYPAAPGADSVGAGDGCAAAIVAGLLAGHGPAEVVALANRVGAYIASQPGATPRLPAELRPAIGW
jgi:fructokinase